MYRMDTPIVKNTRMAWAVGFLLLVLEVDRRISNLTLLLTLNGVGCHFIQLTDYLINE